MCACVCVCVCVCARARVRMCVRWGAMAQATETEPECWNWGGGWAHLGLPGNQPSLGLLFQISLQRPSEVGDFLVGLDCLGSDCLGICLVLTVCLCGPGMCPPTPLPASGDSEEGTNLDEGQAASGWALELEEEMGEEQR